MVTQETRETQETQAFRAPQDAPEGGATSPAEQDIYELLGIDHRASILLAQDIYWRRVNALLEADRGGDPGARARIEELNAALAVIMDDERRTAYDREHGYSRNRSVRQSREGQPSRVESRARLRSLAVVALIPVTGIAMWLALSLSPFAAVGVGILGIAVLLLAARWANRGIVEGMSPFRMLRLREGASLEDVQAAYQAEVGYFLIRARRDDRAIRQLEALDRAYLSATAIILSGSAATQRSLFRQWTGGVGRFFSPLVHAPSAATHSRRIPATVPAVPVGSDFDVERRLSATLGEVTERVATVPLAVDGLGNSSLSDGTPDAIAASPPEARSTTSAGPISAASAVRASLVLESAAGRRNVPVAAVPLRIGSDAACDLVLRGDGVMPEHAIAWLREDAVILHAIHHGADFLVNGEPMTWAVLEDGDVIEFGDVTIGLSIKGEASLRN